MIKWKAKIIRGLLTALALFFAAATLFVASGRFHLWLSRQVTTQLTAILPLQVHMGKLQGNLIREIRVNDLALCCDQDTLFQAQQLTLRWRPLHLLRARLTIDRIVLEKPLLHLQQNADSSWNFECLAGSGDSSQSAPWSYLIRDLLIHDGTVRIQSLATQQSTAEWHIEHLILQATGRYSEDASLLWIKKARADILPYDLRIDQLMLSAQLSGDAVQIDSFKLQSAQSRLSLSGQTALVPPHPFSLHFLADSLDLREVRTLSGTTLPETKLAAQVLVNGDRDSLTWQIDLGDHSGHIRGRGFWLPSREALTAELRIDSLNLQPWSGLAGSVQGRLQMAGSGFARDAAAWRAQIELENASLLRYRLNHLTIDADLHKALAQARLTGATPGGRLRGSARINLNAPYHYQLSLLADDLDLACLTQMDTLKSRSHLQLQASGTGLNPQDARVQFRLHGNPRLAMRPEIDTLLLAGRYTSARLDVDTLFIQAPWVHCSASGSREASGQLTASLRGHIHDSTVVKSYLGVERLALYGSLQGDVSGRLDSLRLSARIALDSSRYNDIAIKTCTASVAAMIADNVTADIALHAGGVVAEQFLTLDTLAVTAALSGRQAQAQLMLASGDSLAAHIRLVAQAQDSLWHIDLPQLDISQNRLLFQLDGDSTRFTVSPRRIHINRFALRQADQRIYVQGYLSLDDSTHLQIGIEHLDLATLQRLSGQALAVTGTLKGHLDLAGTTHHPRLTGYLHIDRPVLAGFAADSLAARCTLLDRTLTWQALLAQNPQNQLQLSGFIPFHLAWPLPQQIVPADKPLRIEAVTRNLQISFLSAASADLAIKGLLNGEIIIDNTLADLRPGGYLQLSEGSLMAPYLGRPYHPIRLRIEVTPEKLALRDLEVHSASGRLTGEGEWQFSRSSRGLHFKDIDLRLRANDFAAADDNDLTIVLTGHLALSGPLEQPRLVGKMNVTRGRIYLPAFTETPSTIWQADQPLLVVARADTLQQSYDRTKLMPSWLSQVEKIRGSVKVEIPRNTWLRSPEMNIEIAGEMDVVKDAPAFSIFGAIRIVRGNYEFYSRRFDIQEGTLTFSGGKNLPQIEFTAQHVFRSADKTRHVLSLGVSGELEKPALQFKLDERSIAEADAVSYLVFGRSFDDLTHGEKSNLAAEQSAFSGEAVKQLIAGQITGQVTRSIQNTLDLDVIEFKGDQNWRQATVVVGKYLTNDLYVSYERQLNLGRGDEVVPEQMTLEYEIIKSLYLQATRSSEQDSGFDLIWKWEK